jgi:hypothetical protein
LFVQRLSPVGDHQLRGNMLKTLCGVNLCRQHLLAFSRCRIGGSSSRVRI